MLSPPVDVKTEYAWGHASLRGTRHHVTPKVKYQDLRFLCGGPVLNLLSQTYRLQLSD
jgi:hypothetical protein